MANANAYLGCNRLPQSTARPHAGGLATTAPAGRGQGSAYTNTLLPRLKSSCVLPPQPIATYCFWPTVYDTGIAFAPAPHWKLHRSFPVFESSALNRPFPSPKKKSPPPVASPPPINGCWVSYFHATLPLSTFTAATRPHCFSLGITLNAPPSQSFEPPGYFAVSTW